MLYFIQEHFLLSHFHHYLFIIIIYHYLFIIIYLLLNSCKVILLFLIVWIKCSLLLKLTCYFLIGAFIKSKTYFSWSENLDSLSTTFLLLLLLLFLSLLFRYHLLVCNAVKIWFRSSCCKFCNNFITFLNYFFSFFPKVNGLFLLLLSQFDVSNYFSTLRLIYIVCFY